jgi:hypothetical protein
MGYTIGRKHTDESLLEACKQYKTRSELQLADPSIYRTCLLRGHEFLNQACSHMVSGHSTPQLICKLILESVLKTKCSYNDRKTIKPYELDIYFPEFNLAIEYNGKGWHNKEEVIARDEIKKQRCQEIGINLIVLIENNRSYEEDVKEQIISNLDLINLYCNSHVKEKDIVEIDCSKVFDEILEFRDLDSLKEKIASCKNIAEFQRKFSNEAKYIRNSNLSYLLERIREKTQFSIEEIKAECENFSCIREMFRQNPRLYHRCWKRGLMESLCSHMTNPNQGKFSKFKDEDLISKAREIEAKTKTGILRANDPLHREIKKRGIPWDKCLIKTSRE